MKNLFTFLSIVLFSISSLFAQTDAERVAKWQLPIYGWFAGAAAPAVGIDAYPRQEAKAEVVTSFDAAAVDFDTKWGSVAGDGNVIANISGNSASNTGFSDLKDAAFKVLYDENKMYILLQFFDDDITGNESINLCLSPYFKLDAPDRTDFPTAWYTRWSQFGANKLVFNKTGFASALMANFDVDGIGSVIWEGTTETLTNNLSLVDKTVEGSNKVKWIISIGYPVLTGEYRPLFNKEIWKTLNGGKGISFDLVINDTDTDDGLDGNGTPKPAIYWWNEAIGESWWSNIFAGFLGVKNTTGLDLIPTQAELSVYPNPANNSIVLKNSSSFKIKSVSINNISGQLVKHINAFEESSINIQDLRSGVYFVHVITDGNIVNNLKFIKQ
ncbi:MAG TPA: T9SS type A sorting domain-containing protein [Prolixibacteraceae bacterium]|jgi:hypothetical protein